MLPAIRPPRIANTPARPAINPIAGASDGRCGQPARGFLPRRLSDAGRDPGRTRVDGRHLKPFTTPVVRQCSRMPTAGAWPAQRIRSTVRPTASATSRQDRSAVKAGSRRRPARERQRRSPRLKPAARVSGRSRAARIARSSSTGTSGKTSRARNERTNASSAPLRANQLATSLKLTVAITAPPATMASSTRSPPGSFLR